jgi:repressor LexA
MVMESVACKNFGPALEVVPAVVAPGRRIPLVGEIAAGAPVLSFQILESIEVPGASWQRRDVFALRVRGTSMIEDGILDGDYLLVERRTEIRDGQTVVADVDGQATVKRLYHESDGAVRLQPANERLLPLTVRGDRIQVRGVVVGVLRKHGFAGRTREPRAPRRSPSHSARGTTDLAIRILEQNVTESTRVMMRASDTGVQRAGELKELAQSLRALHATYVETRHPRLRKALLDEAARIMRQLRAIGRRFA